MIDGRRLKAGDLVIAAAGACLLAALINPALSARRFHDRVETATDEVEAIRAAALGAHEARGAWPSTTNPAVAPAGLGGVFTDGEAIVRDGHDIEWDVWDVVERVAAPPSAAPMTDGADAPLLEAEPPTILVVRQAASITVRSGSDALLSALSERYGARDSYVRDSTWTLVLRPGAGRP